ncbi:MAG TPA: RNB domain-containing ribonuclease, partial [Puia sp.]|nr:RNB domain-containing ribonuclease [Puia sp.]
MGHKKTEKIKKKSGAQLYKGILEVTRSGMGFVIAKALERDILVRPNDFNTAMHGDTVLVRITQSKGSSGRVQGVVESVVERKQTDFPGHIEMGEGFAFFIPETARPMPDVYIPMNKLNAAVHGDRVIVRITEWGKNKKPQGEILQVLDEADENDRVMKEILIENGFDIVFPAKVLEESTSLPDAIPESDISERKDYRKVLTFTIDPADAKDFDDAISFRKLKNDIYEIGVHIADVSHYVKPGSSLDEEAYDRATSVYLPDRVNPMLPERISNELCSLRPHEDKLCFSAVFHITHKGEIKEYWLGRTVIHSDHRFAYEDVQEIIEKNAGEYSEEISILHHLAQRFRKQRIKKGAINFSSVEVRFKLDEKGKPVGILVKESRESHQLIEEFMLLANRTVASHV